MVKNLIEITKSDIHQYISQHNSASSGLIVTNRLWILVGRIFGMLGAVKVKNSGEGYSIVYVRPKKLKEFLSKNSPEAFENQNFPRNELVKKFVSFVKEAIDQQKSSSLDPRDEYSEEYAAGNIPINTPISTIKNAIFTSTNIVQNNVIPQKDLTIFEKDFSSTVNTQKNRKIGIPLAFQKQLTSIQIPQKLLTYIMTLVTGQSNNKLNRLLLATLKENNTIQRLKLPNRFIQKSLPVLQGGLSSVVNAIILLKKNRKIGIPLAFQKQLTSIQIPQKLLTYIMALVTGQSNNKLNRLLLATLKENNTIQRLKLPNGFIQKSLPVLQGGLSSVANLNKNRKIGILLALQKQLTSIQIPQKLLTYIMALVTGQSNKKLDRLSLTLLKQKNVIQINGAGSVVPLTGYENVHKMKQTEKKAVYQAIYNEATNERYRLFIKFLESGLAIPLYDSASSVQKDVNNEDFIAIHTHSDNHEIYKSKINFINKQKKNTHIAFIVKELSKLHKRITKEILQQIYDYLSDINKEIDADLTSIIEITKKKIPKFPEDIQQRYDDLCKELHLLHKMILEAPSENGNILYQLRKCQQHQAYQALKWDESIPAVQYLHGVSIASYLNVDERPYFEALSKPFASQNFQPMAKTVAAGYKSAVDQGIIYDDATVDYLLQFPKQRLGAFLSTSFGTTIANFLSKTWIGNFISNYDPRGFLENSAGQFLSVEHKNSRTYLIHTPSPTDGDSVALEVHLTLQALENRFITLLSNQDIGDIAYTNLVHWNYANLQDIDSSAEGPRSRSIMQLQEEYPTSFSANTLSKDSKFYMDGIHSKVPKDIVEEMIKRQTKTKNNSPTLLNHQYKESMKNEILNDVNYSIDSANRKTGYYFPIDTDNEQEFSEWKKAIQNILDEAYQLTVDLEVSDEVTPDFRTYTAKERGKIFQWQQKASFRELVTLGITLYFEEKIRQKLPTGSSAMYNKSCKECIDRGGKMTALMAYALIENEENAIKTAFEALMGRPILARFRVPLAHRIQPLISLTTLLSHKAIYNFAGKFIQRAAS